MKHLKFHEIFPICIGKEERGNRMKKDASSTDGRTQLVTSIGKFIDNIFRYLSCREEEPRDNRVLLRRLYNSGYLDDQKFQDLCKKSSDNNLDPEELPM
jgi:hypothetical protein